LENYTYDPVGNRTDSNQNGLSQFNTANELHEDGDFTYQYDNNGASIRKTAKVGGAITSYEYDAENELVRVVGNATTINYKYDGLGRRVEKEIISGTTKVTRYIYDNEDILLELDGSNNIVARYTHGPGIDEPLIMEKGGVNSFYHADGLGSITEITNQSGTPVQRYTYSSFGEIESQLDPNFIQPYTFTAREFDPETGLYFYRARHYDPATGRFVQQDPIGFAGGDLNLYRYVFTNPVNFVDPSGKIMPLVIIIPVVAGVLNGTLKAIDASLQCDATAMKVLEAFGNGALAGMAGSVVGLTIGGLTGNPLLAGAAGGLAANLTGQWLNGAENFDAISATVGVVAGGTAGFVTPRLIPLRGRAPSLTTFRDVYGPNSYARIEQRILGGLISSTIKDAAGVLGTSRSNGCGCN
jgi:RHS repeat-associated protein